MFFGIQLGYWILRWSAFITSGSMQPLIFLFLPPQPCVDWVHPDSIKRYRSTRGGLGAFMGCCRVNMLQGCEIRGLPVSACCSFEFNLVLMAVSCSNWPGQLINRGEVTRKLSSRGTILQLGSVYWRKKGLGCQQDYYRWRCSLCLYLVVQIPCRGEGEADSACNDFPKDRGGGWSVVVAVAGVSPFDRPIDD